jgi:hypothetical protein
MEFVCLVMGLQSLHVPKYVRVSFASLFSVMGNHLEQSKIFRSFPTSGLVTSGVYPNFKNNSTKCHPYNPLQFCNGWGFLFFINMNRGVPTFV